MWGTQQMPITLAGQIVCQQLSYNMTYHACVRFC